MLKEALKVTQKKNLKIRRQWRIQKIVAWEKTSKWKLTKTWKDAGEHTWMILRTLFHFSSSVCCSFLLSLMLALRAGYLELSEWREFYIQSFTQSIRYHNQPALFVTTFLTSFHSTWHYLLLFISSGSKASFS